MHAKLGAPDPNVDGRMSQVLADGYREDKDGLIYRDYTEGGGEMPTDGQEARLLCALHCCRPGSAVG